MAKSSDFQPWCRGTLELVGVPPKYTKFRCYFKKISLVCRGASELVHIWINVP